MIRVGFFTGRTEAFMLGQTKLFLVPFEFGGQFGKLLFLLAILLFQLGILLLELFQGE